MSHVLSMSWMIFHQSTPLPSLAMGRHHDVKGDSVSELARNIRNARVHVKGKPDVFTSDPAFMQFVFDR